ncbi:hypothetical protein [Paractinoplanes durhamensis]|uniref:Uncharacterized protein n=1 Tax=Paractinoplanes durhamensis TaxID=113563 RepID=A0ABQ3Z2Z8_9ACTN|nr:hypothetical protein [Actinoplanes durhamensis]GIE04193.1 hypothetical protein Adu01nite_55430 [Actinoplanes durhamensis]
MAANNNFDVDTSILAREFFQGFMGRVGDIGRNLKTELEAHPAFKAGRAATGEADEAVTALPKAVDVAPPVIEMLGALPKNGQQNMNDAGQIFANMEEELADSMGGTDTHADGGGRH